MKSSSRSIFTPGMLVASIFLGLIAATLCLGLLFIFKPAVEGSGLNAVFTVIPAPTATVILPTEALPTPSLSPAELASGKIEVDTIVKINGTGGDGLRLRMEPGVNAAPINLGKEGEEFLVVDGPQRADGFNWWKLKSAKDAGRTGWAAADFLAVVPE
jgi:hypothetical protein